MPAAKTGPTHKFARPFHEPYRVLEVTVSNAKVVPVDKPQGTPIFVALARIRHCPEEIPEGERWPPPRKKAPLSSGSSGEQEPETQDLEEQAPEDSQPTEPRLGIWSNRLRSRRSRTPGRQGGDM